MSLPFKALVIPGGLALAGGLWHTSHSSKPETKDGAVSTVELSELTEKDKQCTRSIATRAPVSDSLDEHQDIVKSCEEIEQLQDPVTCQDEPEIMVIGQPTQSSEKIKELQSIWTWPRIVDISLPIQSSEKIEELQGIWTYQEEPEIVDIGQPDETCEEKEITSSMGQWAKPLDLSTLMSEKPFVHRCPQRPQMCKRPKERTKMFVWEATVPKSLIGRFIGAEGWQVKSLMEESGANIVIKTLRSSEEFQLIVVTGTLKQIGKAAAMIREWFKTFKVDLPLYTPRRVSLR